MPPAAKKMQSIPMPPQIAVQWEYIDRDRANEYLARNIETNRFVRKFWLETLVATMVAGDFVPTHQGIAFDDRGRLVDGQHRLMAIAESGVPCWLLVSRGLPRAALLAMDLHAKRKPSDQIHMVDDSIRPTTSDVALARMMKAGMNVVGEERTDHALHSTAEIHHFLLEHFEAIRFAQQYSVSGTRSAGIRAVIARAYYHADRAKLARFLEVFTSMLAENPREHAAVNFRKWHDDPRNRHIVAGGWTARAKLYAFAISAVQAFLKGQVGRVMRPAEEDPWPLPENA